MQVVFIQNIKGIARKGDIKNVKEGYFQNFLAPRKLAVLATADKLKQAEEMKKKMIIEKERLVEDAKHIQKKIDGLKLVLKRKSHEDKLYAAITEKDIIEEILTKAKIRLSKENFSSPVAIKSLGMADVNIKLAEGGEFKISLEIKSE